VILSVVTSVRLSRVAFRDQAFDLALRERMMVGEGTPSHHLDAAGL